MPGLYTKLIKPIHFCGDLLIINFSFFLSYYFTYDHLREFINNHYFSLFIFYNASWIILTSVLNAYHLYRVQTVINLLNSILKILFIYFVAIEVYNSTINVFDYPRSFLFRTYILIGSLIPLWRMATLISLRIYRRRGFNFRKVVIVGVDGSSKQLINFFFTHPEHGYKLLWTFDVKKYQGFSQLFEDVKNYCLAHEIDEIYCTYSIFNVQEINAIVSFANHHVMRVKFLPDVLGYSLKQLKIDFYDNIPVIIFKPTPLDDNLSKIIKRVFDVIFSLFVVLFVFTWLFPIIAIAVKINSRGPVFFRQKRSGLDNEDFWCWKFRTMHVNKESDSVQATKADVRITRFGMFLRKYSIDELPQFLNVLVGNMSIVGPRPHMLKHTREYSEIIDKYMVRHFIKPGITGLAQVKGYRGETSDPAKMDRRVQMDIFYMENWSFLLDVKIVFMTIRNVFSGEDNAG